MPDIDIGPLSPTAAQANDAMVVRRGVDPTETVALVAVADFATAAQGVLADSAVQPGDLAAVATSGSASDLSAGTLPAARFDDTAHGSRGGGTLHANATTSVAGFMSDADKLKLDGIASGAQVNVPTNLSYDAATRTVASDTGTDAVLTLVDNTNPGLAIAPDAGPDRFYAFTDFINTTTSEFWATSNTGAGAFSTVLTTPSDGGIGWVRHDLGTTTTGRAAFGSTGWGMRFSLGRARAGIRVRILNLSDGTNTWTFRAGFSDNLLGEATDGAFFRYTDSVNGGRFQAVTRNNGAETATDTGITVAASTTYRLLVDVNDAGTSVDFYIDGVLVATNTTNIPTASGRETGIVIMSLRSAGTSAFSSATFDYLWGEQRFAGR